MGECSFDKKGRRQVHKLLWEFSSLTGYQNRNFLLSQRSASLGFSNSLGAFLFTGFILQEGKSRRNKMMLYKLGESKIFRVPVLLLF